MTAFMDSLTHLISGLTMLVMGLLILTAIKSEWRNTSSDIAGASRAIGRAVIPALRAFFRKYFYRIADASVVLLLGFYVTGYCHEHWGDPNPFVFILGCLLGIHVIRWNNLLFSLISNVFAAHSVEAVLKLKSETMSPDVH